jgi:hypothetical protein
MRFGEIKGNVMRLSVHRRPPCVLEFAGIVPDMFRRRIMN